MGSREKKGNVFICYVLGHKESWQAPKHSGYGGVTLSRSFSEVSLSFPDCLLVSLPETPQDFLMDSQRGPSAGS